MLRFGVLGGLLAMVAVAGCNQILGIEDHDVQPSSSGANAGQSTGGTAGSGTNAGIAGRAGGSSSGGHSGAPRGGTSGAGGAGASGEGGAGAPAGGAGAAALDNAGQGGAGDGSGGTGCSNACTLSEMACADGSLKTCEQGASGCTEWSMATGCATGTCADTTKCLLCNDECTSGETSCMSGQIAVCQADDKGCLYMPAGTNCSSGFCALTSSCGACDNKCDPGVTVCSGGSLSQCNADADGCLDFSTPNGCPSGFCANSTTCGVCNNQCSSGATSCASGKLSTCVADTNGCLNWGASPSNCPSGFCANSTTCGTCDNKCSIGQFTCSGSTLVACAADANGCRDYTGSSTSCSGDTPVCDASGGRCACSVAPSHCQNSTTALACTNGAVTTVPCTGSTPTCVDGSACVPCTEHSQCPGTACHLAGLKVGSCFASSSVVNVTTAAALQTAVSGLASGAEKVIRLTASGNYALTAALNMPANAEVAMIGATSGVTVSNSFSSSDSRNAILIINSGNVYLAKFAMIGTTGISALSVVQGSLGWFDDLKVSGYYRSLASAGEVHARRSWFKSNGLPMLIQTGSVFLENTTVGPNVDSNGYSTEGVSLLNVGGTTIDFRYVSLVGSTNAINCGNAVPPIGGTIKNSILASQAGDSVAGGTAGSNCSTIQFINDAVDQAGFGTTIAWYNQNWFTAPDSGNFHLTAAGKSAIPKVAGYASGDPKVDIDGQARPASNGYPGVDEP